VHVSGDLEAAGASVPVAFDASVRMIDGELELEATTTVDQGRFGMSRGPFRNVRPPTTLHVKTRLVRKRRGPAWQRSSAAWQRPGSNARQSPIDTTSEGRSNG
jgi:hypothetical protein